MKNQKSFQIIKCAMEVHNSLGHGFLEKVYSSSLAIELKQNGFFVETEKSINVFYKKQHVGLYYADLFVDDSIIIEIKCVERIIVPHIMQVKNYLKATSLSWGFIFNFKKPSLDFNKVFS